MTAVNGLVPARFLTLISHLVITIVIFWSREENVKADLPLDYTQAEYDAKDVKLIIGLGVTFGLFLLELISFISGISMFMHSQAMISTAAHASASIALAFFLLDVWQSHYYWYVFGFCSAFPACTELIVIIGVLGFRKGV